MKRKTLEDRERKNLECLMEMCIQDGRVDRYAIISAEIYVRKLHFNNYNVEKYDFALAHFKKMYRVQELGRVEA